MSTPTRSTVAAPSSDIDLFADEVLLDPYPTYAALRELGSVVHLPANDVYALTRYEVVRDALADWETFSSAHGIGFNPMVNEALAGTSLPLTRRSTPPCGLPSPRTCPRAR
jgi:cytochrome P450